jgi:hypothetical protein
MRISPTALAALSMACTPAFANCSWEWLCNGEGNCKHMPVCESVFEFPPPRPEAKPPVAPPLSIRPFRTAGPTHTSLTCEHIMRQGKSGRWYWNEACFCTDKTKNPEPSNPFANIVRCDDPHATPAPAAPPQAPAKAASR